MTHCFSVFCLVMHAWPAVVRASVEIKLRNVQLFSQLIRRSAMGATNLEQYLWHYEHSIQSSGGELAEENCSQQ